MDRYVAGEIYWDKRKITIIILRKFAENKYRIFVILSHDYKIFFKKTQMVGSRGIAFTDLDLSWKNNPYSNPNPSKKKIQTHSNKIWDERITWGRELIKGRGSRCANYSRARTNRGRELFGLLGYIQVKRSKVFRSQKLKSFSVKNSKGYSWVLFAIYVDAEHICISRTWKHLDFFKQGLYATYIIVTCIYKKHTQIP